MVRNTESGPSFLDEQFSEIVDYIPQRDKLDTRVSKVDVAWHIDHSLKTINRVCEALKNSDPNQYNSNFSLSRLLIYTWGDFPRGVAKAPKHVLPPDTISTEDLYLQLKEAKKNLKKLEVLEADTHFKHPYFKVINKKQTKRFLKIHTKHHLKIVRDILGKQP